MIEQSEIPEGWELTTLGSLGNYLNGRAFKSSEWSKTGRPIIRIQDLTGSHRNPNFFDGEVEDRYLVLAGDLLISWSATLGAYIWSGPEGVLNQHIFKVEPKVDKLFLYHLVRERLSELGRQSHGSGMVHVTKGVFDGTSVAVPKNPEEQRRIAKAIDCVEVQQSSARSHLVVADRRLRQFRQAVLTSACTGRLTEAEQPRKDSPNEIEEILTEFWRARKPRRQKEQAVALDLPELPERFTVRPLGDLTVIIEYGTSQRCDSDPKAGIPVLRMGNIQNGSLDFGDLKYCAADRELEGLLLEDGDLLFNRTNSPELVGKSAVFHAAERMSFASYLIRVRLLDRVAHPDYVNYWLNSAWGRAWASLAKTDGVSQSNINGSKLALMPIPLPPFEEQIRIVARASALLNIAEELIAKVEKADRAIERTAQSVLAKAFRGELVPR
jgi:type I restriction enzyme S subunit